MSDNWVSFLRYLANSLPSPDMTHWEIRVAAFQVSVHLSGSLPETLPKGII